MAETHINNDPSIDKTYDLEIRPLIDLVDSLRHVGISATDSDRSNNIYLPQIAVMGDQSSGKSSVLEAISGIPFPRGSGLVTRCPTQIIMKKLVSKQSASESEVVSPPVSTWDCSISVDWGINSSTTVELMKQELHNLLKTLSTNNNGVMSSSSNLITSARVPTKEKLTDLISNITDILTGGNFNHFSTASIVIRITAEDAPDLTIIDLPGIIRTTTFNRGSSQEDINGVSVIEQVNDLINSYMVQENTIILAVIPSNQDIATIDILERANKVDPLGNRTIGVLTKPDLIGEGGEDEVISVLTNIRKPLKLGYIMVKNASQKDINEGVSAASSRENEMKFFRNHCVFGPYFQNTENSNGGTISANTATFGVTQLVSRLTSVLVDRIKQSLPSLKYQIEMQLQHTRAEVERLNADANNVPSTPKEQQALIMKQISRYCTILNNSRKGEYREYPLNNSTSTNVGGDIRLHSANQALFKQLQISVMKLRPQGMQTDQAMAARIAEKMTTQQGRELPGFLSTQVFYSEIIESIEYWKPLIDQCRSDIINSTLAICCRLLEIVMCGDPGSDGSGAVFPELYERIKNSILIPLVETYAENTTTKLEELVSRELLDPMNAVTNSTAQDSLLEAVNGIRQRTFENAMREILDTSGMLTEGSAAGSSAGSAASAGMDIDEFREELRFRLGCWYMNRHGVGGEDTTASESAGSSNSEGGVKCGARVSGGSVHEMITLIQAYWDVASKRMIDNVCMCVETEFVTKLLEEVETQCFLYGVAVSNQELSQLLRANPELVARKHRYKEQLNRLEKAMSLFNNVAPSVQVLIRPT